MKKKELNEKIDRLAESVDNALVVLGDEIKREKALADKTAKDIDFLMGISDVTNNNQKQLIAIDNHVDMLAKSVSKLAELNEKLLKRVIALEKKNNKVTYIIGKDADPNDPPLTERLEIKRQKIIVNGREIT